MCHFPSGPMWGGQSWPPHRFQAACHCIMRASIVRHGADDRCLSSAHHSRTRQATKNDGLPHSESVVQLFLGHYTTTRRYCYVFSTGSTPGLFAKSMNLQIIKTEENAAEIDFSFDCNIDRESV